MFYLMICLVTWLWTQVTLYKKPSHDQAQSQRTLENPFKVFPPNSLCIVLIAKYNRRHSTEDDFQTPSRLWGHVKSPAYKLKYFIFFKKCQEKGTIEHALLCERDRKIYHCHYYWMWSETHKPLMSFWCSFPFFTKCTMKLANQNIKLQFSCTEVCISHLALMGYTIHL